MTITWTANSEVRRICVKSNPEAVPSKRLDTWFELLADRRFRHLITILERRSDDVMETQELFNQFCHRSISSDTEVTDCARSRLRIDFHHRLLPKLVSTGVVADADRTDGVQYKPSEEFEALFACMSGGRFPGEEDQVAAAKEEGTRDDILMCLADYRRRVTLTLLRTYESISLADLADEVAKREQGRPLCDIEAKQVLKVYMSLYHNHLPRLTNAGLINYDQQADWVSLSDRSTDVDCYRPFLPSE